MLSDKDQCEFDDYALVLGSLAALNAWDKVEESGKGFESFTKIIQDPKEAFSNFLNKDWLQL